MHVMEVQLSGQVRSERDLVAWLSAGGLRGADTFALWDAGLTDAAAFAIANDVGARWRVHSI